MRWTSCESMSAYMRVVKHKKEITLYVSLLSGL